VSRNRASRYQPVLAALHWLIAALILGLLCLGFFVLADMPNADPAKLRILVWHMTGGMLVLLLMLVRLAVRVFSARPGPAPTGSASLDRLAPLAHFGLYLVVFLMIASGWYTGLLISGAYAHKGETLPASFAVLPSFRAHAFLAALLVILIGVHVAAALYHQFVLKDGLFGRVWFGRRTIVPAEK
jgi:cytochrome b561